jgi:hypothetical protein
MPALPSSSLLFLNAPDVNLAQEIYSLLVARQPAAPPPVQLLGLQRRERSGPRALCPVVCGYNLQVQRAEGGIHLRGRGKGG